MRTFLSSTYADLRDHRRAAAEALQRLDQDVGRMEVFGARPAEPTAACLDEVEACDLFVGIYAYRYGFRPADSDTSITEQEFNHAQQKSKPLFCFVVSDDHPWPPKFIEGDPGRVKLEAFKERISSRLVRDVFTTAEDLALKVATAVGRHVAKVHLDTLATQVRASMGQGNLGHERLIQGSALSDIPEGARRQVKRMLGELGSMIDRLAEKPTTGNAPVDPKALLTLAQGLMAEGKWLDAGKKYEEYARDRPDDWEANYVRGVAFANSRRGTETNLASLRSYNDAITFAPANIDVNTRARLFGYRGAILKRLGRLEEAEADLLLARRHATAPYEYNDVRYNLAAVYAMMGARDRLLDIIKEISPASEAFLSIHLHLHDYFRAFCNDEEFLGAIAKR
jgi:hypothetical protein